MGKRCDSVQRHRTHPDILIGWSAKIRRFLPRPIGYARRTPWATWSRHCVQTAAAPQLFAGRLTCRRGRVRESTRERVERLCEGEGSCDAAGVRRDRGAAPARCTAGDRPAAQAQEQVRSGAGNELTGSGERGRAGVAQWPGVPAGVRARVGDRVWRVASAELGVSGAGGARGCCALIGASSVSICIVRRWI